MLESLISLKDKVTFLVKSLNGFLEIVEKM